MKKAEEIVERHLTAKGCKCDVMDKTKQYEACLNAVNEALDYARSSLPLKDKEAPTFDEWYNTLYYSENGIKLYKGKEVYDVELIEIYKKEINV